MWQRAPQEHGTKSQGRYRCAMGDTFAISALRRKRGRLAGEIIQAQEVVARRTKELLVIDAVIRMCSSDCDPDMIAPIRPTSHGLFFQ
jgi:hypothetical protein